MLATFFEWRVVAGREQAFVDSWEQVTRVMCDAGSFGSALFRNDAGHYCALARWPNREVRDAAFEANRDMEASAVMHTCIIEEIARIDMGEVSNLWFAT